MDPVPVAGNVSALDDPHVLVIQDMVEKSGEASNPSGMADEPAVQ